MSKVLSLKLQDAIYDETEKITHRIKMPRNAYINQAVSFYNKIQKRALLKKEFARESKLVRNESMKVLKAFEAMEDDFPQAA